MRQANKPIVINFIEEIWNQKQFGKIDKYVSAHFIDHSLPPTFSANKDGMKLWIIGTGKAFEHKTIIDNIVSEGGQVMIKMKMQLKHIGVWREMPPTQLQIEATGCRLFHISRGKIMDHWALIDGSAIET